MLVCNLGRFSRPLVHRLPHSAEFQTKGKHLTAVAIAAENKMKILLQNVAVAAENGMKVLLQKKDTMNFVQSNNKWTANSQHAREFQSGVEALFYCVNGGLRHMRVVGKFDDARMNFAFPVIEERG